ncbi:MAG: diguanylate cyclase [Comamonas sp.]|nr:diguanylate cyclase [Comamonas sp.]
MVCVSPNQEMHGQFVAQIQMLWSQRKHMTDPATTFVGFLTSWLGLHILGIDQAMARQLSWLNEGMSAADAFKREAQNHNQGTQALLKMIGRLYQTLAAQNAQLAEVNQSLEERVALRTQELEAANQRLSTLARTDALLSIANRAYFNDRLEQACALALRGERPVGIVMLDVDYFKRYNDHYGHLKGDACLQAVALAVGGCLHRNTDLLARYGGEELVVLLHDTDTQGALVVAEKMVQAVRNLELEHANSELQPRHVSISAGAYAAVPYPQASGGSGSSALLARADEALYRAKSQGRNRAVAF